MPLKCHRRLKDGQEHRSWSIGESRRCAGGRVEQAHALRRPKLRRNLTGRPPAALWTADRQLVPGEEAFKHLQGEWRGRPVCHPQRERSEAHILGACLACTLPVWRRPRRRAGAGGLPSRAGREKFCAVPRGDGPRPTTDGRTVLRTRHPQPEQERPVLRTQLKLTRPAQPPPKITAAARAG